MQNSGNHPERRTIIAEIILFILGGLIVVFSSKFPTDWDACQFVLGMNRFSPVDHQPHPPGYFFFLQVAHLVNLVISDPHRSLVITSGIAASLIPPAIHRLTLKIFPDRPDLAFGAGLLALAAPARLFFGAQALAYTWEGLLAILLFSQALNFDPKNDNPSPVPWILWAMLWGVTGGFRPNLMILFLPLGIVLSLRRKLWENLVAVLVAAVITAIWFVPTAIASGGVAEYLQALKGHGAFFVYGGLGMNRTWENAVELYYSWAGVTGAGIIFWIGLLLIARVRNPSALREKLAYSTHSRLVLRWIAVPMILSHLLIFFNDRYSLPYMPILIPLSMQIIGLLFDRKNSVPEPTKTSISKHLCWILPVLICLISWSFFLTQNTDTSLKHIRNLESQISHVAEFVRELGESENVTIVAGRKFRPWGSALPEYTTIHPMRSRYPQNLNPGIAVMENGDTVQGDFYMPGAADTETYSIRPSIIVLDEDAYRVLKKDESEWNPERITSVENLYWREFPQGSILEDKPGELVISPI